MAQTCTDRNMVVFALVLCAVLVLFSMYLGSNEQISLKYINLKNASNLQEFHIANELKRLTAYADNSSSVQSDVDIFRRSPYHNLVSAPDNYNQTLVNVDQRDRRMTHDIITDGGTTKLKPRLPSNDKFVAPDTNWITFRSSGRLGNQMFQYAVLYTVGQLKIWRPYRDVKRFHQLNSVFNKSLTVPTLDIQVNNVKYVQEHFGEDILLKLLSLQDKNVSLGGFFQSHTFFSSFANGIRREFIVSRELVDKVHAFFANHTQSDWVNTTVVRVGIHVRRGDMGPRHTLGIILPPPTYFLHAMEYFKKRHQRVQFIVTGDSVNWWMENMSRSRNVVFSQESYAVDLAILTTCDHIIISVGTFGWWAGWLSRGVTVYHGVKPPAGSHMAKLYESDKWIPPDSEFNKWIPII